MEDVKEIIRKIKSNYEIKKVTEIRQNFLKYTEFALYEKFLLKKVGGFIICYAGDGCFCLNELDLNEVKKEYKKYFYDFIRGFYNDYVMELAREERYKKIFEKAFFNIKGE